jgi:hypothetical protein
MTFGILTFNVKQFSITIVNIMTLSMTIKTGTSSITKLDAYAEYHPPD